MNVSENCKKTVDACRFCWMCRHVCPIGNADGQERDTARARALALSMVVRGSAELTEDIMDNVYECACCNACVNDCATGWDPVAATKEVRLKAAMDGKTPSYIRGLINNCLQTGNPYGICETASELETKIQAHQEKTDTLFYLGSDARFQAPEEAVKAIMLLEKAGVDFTLLAEEPDSGAAMEYLVSASNETKDMMKKAVAEMNRFQKVIVYEPFDAKVIFREYQEWNLGLQAKAVLFPVYLEELIHEGKITLRSTGEKIACQDSYILARDLGETETVRRIIGQCGTLTELLLNRKNTVLAGHLLMAEYMPEIIAQTAARRMHEIKASGAEIVVVGSVAEKLSLASQDKEIKTVTVEELILTHMA